MRSVNAIFDHIVTNGETDKAPNRNGNSVTRFHDHTDRYIVDFAELFTAEHWQQYDTDQDAHYFGVWFNRHSLRTLTYAEGDWIAVQCTCAASFNAEMIDKNSYYQPGIAFTVIDANSVTHVMQDRQTFLIEPAKQ